MARWDLIDADAELETVAAQVYRPDIYRAAVAPLGVSVPQADTKIEGAHDTPWLLNAIPTPIAMGPDRFCDHSLFGKTEASVHS